MDTEQEPLDTAKESKFSAAKASTEGLEFIVRHTTGKNYQRSRLPKLCNMLKI
jgi:hypothetical protein